MKILNFLINKGVDFNLIYEEESFLLNFVIRKNLIFILLNKIFVYKDNNVNLVYEEEIFLLNFVIRNKYDFKFV